MVRFQIERLVMRHDADLFAAREDALGRTTRTGRDVSQKATERDRQPDWLSAGPEVVRC